MTSPETDPRRFRRITALLLVLLVNLVWVGDADSRFVKVRRTQSIERFAKAWNVSPHRLRKVNSLPSRLQDLHKNQLVRVPNSAIPRDPESGLQRYTVRSGDTLSTVADQFLVGTGGLRRRNPEIKNPDKIYPGQVISVEWADLSKYELVKVAEGDVRAIRKRPPPVPKESTPSIQSQDPFKRRWSTPPPASIAGSGYVQSARARWAASTRPKTLVKDANYYTVEEDLRFGVMLLGARLANSSVPVNADDSVSISLRLHADAIGSLSDDQLRGLMASLRRQVTNNRAARAYADGLARLLEERNKESVWR